MTDTHEPNIVVVTGDVTMDWNLARTRRSDSGGDAWNADDCTRAYWQRGGAALLADLIEAVAGELRLSGQADYSLREMGAPRDQALPGDPRFHHSYAMWSLFDYDVKSSRDKNKPPQAWRVGEFLGLDRCTTDAGAAEWKRVQDDTPEAEIVVLDDADLGFRDHPELWPRTLASENAQPWILLKMARPVAQGELWDHLHKHHAGRLIVVMSVNDLRLTEVQISRELSWERTAQDLAWELVHNPRVNALSHCAHVVISFDTAGALLLSRRQDAAPKCRLFFDPKVIEGMWGKNYEGNMIGYTSCLTAGIARQLMRSAAAPDIDRGIQSGLGAMRKLHLEGYGARGAPAPDAALAFPAALIASELSKDSSQFSVAEVQDPLIYVTEPSAETRRQLERGFWTILEDRYTDSLGKVAEQIVIEGAEAALKDVPLGQFGNLLTVDRREIESFRSIRALVSEYCRKERQKRPLSIAVFGAPGSGKSFGVIQVAESLRPGEIKVLEFNLSQFSDTGDVLDALHQVRDAGLSGLIPLVFWDEFDTTLTGQRFGWLRHFLAPMQDGRFQQGQISHPIGRSIFVFAGGVSETMGSFGEDMPEQDFRDVKGPDFVSRLKGYVNILGPNPPKTSSDPYYVIRRAILLRSILRRDAAQLFERTRDKEVLNIDSGVLRALLHTSKYKHGVRSIESVIAMSQLIGKHRFERSCLPAVEQLDLHVDAHDFQALVQRMELEDELLEKLAEAAHEVFVQELLDGGYRLGQQTDDELKTHSSMKPYSELPEDEKQQNRSNVRDISNKLARSGYVMIPARSNEPPFDFPGADLEMLAAMEHERWMKTKIDAGWRWAPETDKAKQLHNDLLAWRKPTDEERARLSSAEAAAIGPDELPEQEKEKDRVLVRGIPKILAQAGYTVVKVSQ
ncbi:MAG: RyR domain-containing protein [Acidobacteriota bacterium]